MVGWCVGSWVAIGGCPLWVLGPPPGWVVVCSIVSRGLLSRLTGSDPVSPLLTSADQVTGMSGVSLDLAPERRSLAGVSFKLARHGRSLGDVWFNLLAVLSVVWRPPRWSSSAGKRPTDAAFQPLIIEIFPVGVVHVFGAITGVFTPSPSQGRAPTQRKRAPRVRQLEHSQAGIQAVWGCNGGKRPAGWLLAAVVCFWLLGPWSERRDRIAFRAE